MKHKFDQLLQKISLPVPVAPLVTFRVIFGTVMFISILRFILKGWVYQMYVEPRFYFPYYGFEWIKPLGETGMYLLFAGLAVSSVLIALGYFYRIATVFFFLTFTYVELIDKTNYLNHYYFISIISFLLCLVPSHRSFSLDVRRKPSLKLTHVPSWIIGVFKLQLGIVYFFAGVAKLNSDWMLEAMPLKIWLPAHTDLPLIGSFMDEVWVAYAFSWAGAFYDLLIPFLLLSERWRKYAYFILLLFHVLTSIMFPIGMFPYIMMGLTLVFFSNELHERILGFLRNISGWFRKNTVQKDEVVLTDNALQKNYLLISLLLIHFIIQLALPFRYLLYPGDLFWTEQGFRFSWRVMLMEKAGTAFFYVKDPESGRECEIRSCTYLTCAQEKMMSTQPDMILQFAHYLEDEFRKKGIKDPVVTVESYVTLNGSGSRLFLDRNVDLTLHKESFLHKSWILPFKKN